MPASGGATKRIRFGLEYTCGNVDLQIVADLLGKVKKQVSAATADTSLDSSSACAAGALCCCWYHRSEGAAAADTIAPQAQLQLDESASIEEREFTEDACGLPDELTRDADGFPIFAAMKDVGGCETMKDPEGFPIFEAQTDILALLDEDDTPVVLLAFF